MSKTKLAIILLLTLSIFGLINSRNSSAQWTYNLSWSNELAFGITNYNTKIEFDSTIYLNSFSFNEGENITLSGLYVDASVPEIVLGSTSNITVTQLDSDTLSFNVASSGTQKIKYGTKTPLTVYVDGATTATDHSDNITTVTGANTNVIIEYAIAEVYGGHGLFIVGVALALGALVLLFFFVKKQ